MRGALVAVIVLVVLVVGVVMWGVRVQNDLVRLDQDVNEKWAQVQNVYQRRADLIPNLVETVKGFAAQERTVLTEVTQARASASSIKLTPEALNDPEAMQKFAAAARRRAGPGTHAAAAAHRTGQRLRRRPVGRRSRAARAAADGARARDGRADGHRDLSLARRREPRGRLDPARRALEGRPQGRRQRRHPARVAEGAEASQ